MELAKCFDCGEVFDPADGIVTETTAFCSEACLHAFKAGLGI